MTYSLFFKHELTPNLRLWLWLTKPAFTSFRLATSAVWLPADAGQALPKISQRADFFTVVPLSPPAGGKRGNLQN